MILKQNSGLKLDFGTILFNLAGGAVVLGVLGYAAVSFFHKEHRAACAERYPSPTLMTLRTSSGELFTPMELKSYIGRAQRGVAVNTKTIEISDGDSEMSGISVRLDVGTSTGYVRGDKPGGIGFAWAPEDLTSADAACLRYKVKLPADFDYAAGGLLPGIYGGKPLRADQEAKGDKAFATRIIWRPEGRAAAFSQYEEAGDRGATFRSRRMKLPRGRWVDIQQEIILNQPGRSDGLLRVWIDGELALEQAWLGWRDSEDVSIGGVISEVSYGLPEHNGKAPTTTQIDLSEFELSWKNGTADRTTASQKPSSLFAF